MATKAAEATATFEASLREAEQRAAQAEARLAHVQRAADERQQLASQVQRLLTEVEEAHEAGGRVAGSHVRVAALESQYEVSQKQLLATAAMVQRLEVRSCVRVCV